MEHLISWPDNFGRQIVYWLVKISNGNDGSRDWSQSPCCDWTAYDLRVGILREDKSLSSKVWNILDMVDNSRLCHGVCVVAVDVICHQIVLKLLVVRESSQYWKSKGVYIHSPIRVNAHLLSKRANMGIRSESDSSGPCSSISIAYFTSNWYAPCSIWSRLVVCHSPCACLMDRNFIRSRWVAIYKR